MIAARRISGSRCFVVSSEAPSRVERFETSPKIEKAPADAFWTNYVRGVVNEYLAGGTPTPP